MKTILFILTLIAATQVLGQTSTTNNIVEYRLVAFKHMDNSVQSISNTVEIAKKMNIQVPNAFSPDGDGVNDEFMVVHDGIEEFSMEIYNRWGELVYQTNDTERPWQGDHRGMDCQQDAYVYVISARGLEDEHPTTIKGSVSLIR